MSETSAAISVHVRVPSALAAASSRDAARFEAVWARLPDDDDHVNRFTDVENGTLFLKGQVTPLLWGLRHALSPPGILRELRGLQWMRDAGIMVPDVIAWGVERRLGVVRRCFLVLDRIRDAVDLRRLGRDDDDPVRRRAVLETLGRVVARMHTASLFHRDLSGRNVLVTGWDGGKQPEIVLIDCPRAERGRYGPRIAFLRRADLYRLTRSVLKLGATDDEARLLLDTAGARDPETVLAHAKTSIATRATRPLRANLWLILGL